jgi:hypothetical protein
VGCCNLIGPIGSKIFAAVATRYVYDCESSANWYISRTTPTNDLLRVTTQALDELINHFAGLPAISLVPTGTASSILILRLRKSL